VGSRAFVGTAGMSEKQDLEREIQRLSKIIGASESALKAKAMSASDRAWLTKQLGLADHAGSSLLLVADGTAGDVARRATDQAGADHRAEAASGHGSDAGAQGGAGQRTLLAGGHVLTSTEQARRDEQHQDPGSHLYSPATSPIREASCLP
jgi:hypothetical protein